MSQIATEPGNRLSEVLSRIQALSRQERPGVVENAVPRLTEAYDGKYSLRYVEADSQELPTLEDALNSAVVAGQPSLPEAQPVAVQPAGAVTEETLSEKQREQLLREMEPVIRDAVKRAILKELVIVEKALKTTLEQDVMQALKQRLESDRF